MFGGHGYLIIIVVAGLFPIRVLYGLGQARRK